MALNCEDWARTEEAAFSFCSDLIFSDDSYAMSASIILDMADVSLKFVVSKLLIAD